jgi:hypothetical protein
MADEPTACLDELVARLRRLAADRLVGVWLMGSAALADFDPPAATSTSALLVRDRPLDRP